MEIVRKNNDFIETIQSIKYNKPGPGTGLTIEDTLKPGMVAWIKDQIRWFSEIINAFSGDEVSTVSHKD